VNSGAFENYHIHAGVQAFGCLKFYLVKKINNATIDEPVIVV
jgi:hypothetical protein